jgi:uncharacterized damage-inducible protein DinB
MPKIVLFLLFLSPNFVFSQDNFLKEFSAKWLSATAYTQKVMDAMPQKNYGFKPVKEEMSFEEQLIHMANNMNWLGGKFLSEKQAPFPEKQDVKGKSRKEITEIVIKSLAYIQNITDTFDTNRLDEKVDFPAGQLSKRQIFLLLNDHQTHHRAQLLVYLRIKGEKPPAYVGW